MNYDYEKFQVNSLKTKKIFNFRNFLLMKKKKMNRNFKK